ncbi:MAG: ABC transporter ATP-binding protein [Geobacteraceae bacterium]|nr:ABC transporter ATP-binding protein [Geobacteraceae bacterium]NTW79444.1 ABC transporter ATP-binding protein [Geobacteraceae bacterium]
MSALSITGLSKTYRDKKLQKVNALVGLDLAVAHGEVFGFLGPNGAGKSTTIKSIMGLLKPTAGTIQVFGVTAKDPESRRRIGYLPENPSFFDFMTAREYLKFVGSTYGMELSAIRNESVRVLELLDLTQAADRPIRGYSKGMVQRLGLAQALVHDPDMYILDEPMSGLDPIGRALVKDIIRDLKQRGKTIFFSTHITADVEAVCDRVGVIAKGVLESVDTVDNILEKGVVGYAIRFCRAEGAEEEQLVSREELDATLRQLLESSAVIKTVEPKRKDMESFFLSVVLRS